MDLEQFFSRSAGSFAGAFNSRHFNQDLSDEVRELALHGLKLFPVTLAAKLVGDPDRLIAHATDDVSSLVELSAAAQPLWCYRVALGPSGLCVLVLDGAVGRASLAALEECLTLQARRGDVMYALFRQPMGMTRIRTARNLVPGLSILGGCAGFDVPPAGGAIWVNLGAEIEALPYVLRELLASTSPTARRDAQCRLPSLLPALLPARPPCIYRSPMRLRGGGTQSAVSAVGTAFLAAGRWFGLTRSLSFNHKH